MRTAPTLLPRTLSHKCTRTVAAALVTALMAGAQPSLAQQATERRNVVGFTTSATQEISQDLLIVTLQAFKEGSVAAEVQAALKQQLDAALAEARKAAQPGALEVRTGHFSINPRYNNQGRISGWQGQAQMVVQGTDMGRIAQTVGRINQLNVVNVGYGLSHALREKHEAELTAQAIASFRSRAQDIAKGFGMARYTLGEVSIQSGEPGFEGRPAPMMMKAAMADVASAPLPVEPGKGTVTVSVSGQIVLAP